MAVSTEAMDTARGKEATDMVATMHYAVEYTDLLDSTALLP